MSSDYFATLPEPERSRLLNKLSLISQCSCHFGVLLWINNSTQWPDMTYPDIYTHLIHRLYDLIESPGRIRQSVVYK